VPDSHLTAGRGKKRLGLSAPRSGFVPPCVAKALEADASGARGALDGRNARKVTPAGGVFLAFLLADSFLAAASHIVPNLSCPRTWLKQGFVVHDVFNC
jgi:hypothetical protein